MKLTVRDSIGRSRFGGTRGWKPRNVKLPSLQGRCCAHVDPEKGDPVICRRCLLPMEPERSVFDGVLARARRRDIARQQSHDATPTT